MSTIKLLYADSYQVTDKIKVAIPTVGEIIEDEDSYYSLVSTFTAMPIDLMVPLDDMGIDFSEVTAYEVFLLMFGGIQSSDTHLLFGDLDLTKFKFSINEETGNIALVDPINDIVIDRTVHGQIATTLRKIHHLEKDSRRPGNEAAKIYMLERERKKIARHKGKPHESQLESLIISMVNTNEFKYDYSSVLDLSIYQFNESVRQVIKKIDFDNRMHGVYAGTIDAKKLPPDALSWIHDSSK